MTNHDFDVRLVRKFINSPETGLDRLQFEMIIDCDGAQSIAFFGSKDLASPTQTQRVLIEQIGRTPPDRRIAMAKIEAATGQDAPTTIRTSISGWKLEEERWSMFVTPHRTYGDPEHRRIEFVASATGIDRDQQIGSRRGSVESWNSEIGNILRQASAGIVLTAGVLCAPLLLLRPQKETFVLNMAGPSTTGKTSLITGALSIQGPPGFASPEVTPQGLRELGAEHNHLALAVGDLNQLSPSGRKTMMHRLTYEVTSGDARVVSRSVADKLHPVSYRTIIFTSAERQSSEIALVDRSKEVGAAARCFDLMPLPGSFGYFDRIAHGEKRPPKELVEAMVGAVAQNHGALLEAWTKWLSNQDPASLRATLVREAGLLADREKLEDGLSLRIADAFGFMAGALILARRAKVLDWEKEEILDAVQKSLRAVLDRVNERPSSDPLAVLRAVLDEDGAVANVDAVSNGTDKPWLAFVHPQYGLLLRPHQLRKAVGAVAAKSITSELAEANYLLEPTPRQVDLGGKRPRCLVIDPKFMTYGPFA